ncbi:sedoheptulose-1,7 bisphosphatase, putative [Eimeria mitis]|uniref:Sedoheptulose-1,7 bisphosphatase, putative n=1 Tax=Eimeria mitis TaxID=44415 RepID=U6KKI9_9EIME|nr:sedoheptulose-1,7 bisphosphatase, putative [Eimeria mitis]CDJ35958.1 sedoheptulose-1,7 bisphosphatase, putative [Eimeria mitis]
MTREAADFSGLTLGELLDKLSTNADLKSALPTLFKECGRISKALRSTKVTKSGTSNSFGEEQLSVDLLAERQLRIWAKECRFVKAISSEEDTNLEEVNPGGSLVVCWDPLDGSSIIDCNWSVASIFGIWQIGEKGLQWKGPATLIGATGRQLVAALLVIYGPRTTALLSVNGSTFDLQLDPEEGAPVVLRGPCSILKKGAKIFSPANLRAAQDLPAYNEMVQRWMEERYTLRYTGGLGPDVYQLFVKGHGVFCNPASNKAPAKLRLAYEVAPIAFLVEAAGGRSSNGKCSALDVALEKMDHRTAFCCGTEEEVVNFEAAVRL